MEAKVNITNIVLTTKMNVARLVKYGCPKPNEMLTTGLHKHYDRTLA